MDYNKNIATMPLLPLRGITVFPGMMVNFDVERPFSVAALNAAIGAEQEIFLVTQKEIATAVPKANDLYNVGTVCTIHQVLKIPGSNIVKVMVEGKHRARVVKIEESKPCYYASVMRIKEMDTPAFTPKVEATIRSCINLFDEYCELTGTVAPDTFMTIADNDDMGYVADFVAQNVFLRHSDKQEVLSEINPMRRMEKLIKILNREINVISLEKSIEEVTKDEMNKAQRDYYLREQMKVIQRELGGEGFEDSGDEIGEYKEKILALHLPKETEEKLLKELGRLAKQPFGSSEGAVLRTYLDVCLEMPWNTRTEDTTDIAKAKKCLDEDHFGLEKVKDRIIEYLAVRQLAPNLKGSVLCLVGPPGVGKTSIAMSIARATNRKLARISLGGVHDEAEIRGHRKTYVGSMPGRIISGLQQAKSMNPVMVLDEIDKLGSDYKGDPSAALLEALDGEQNGSFRDNFLEIPVDLGEVFFITTANTTSTIPRALLDRMEVIELNSYTDEEKLSIARDHLLPKQRKKHGLNGRTLKISDDAIREIIADYTRESGVRVLERQIAAVCRKTARVIAEGERKSLNIKAGMLESYLGAPKYKNDKVYARDEIGLVRGLAWTSVGGEVLDVEAVVLDGTGKLELTGNIGQVMQESAKAALSYIRSRASILGIDPEFYKKKDIHIHFPEGAVPKDGPSAGITITIALISALTGAPVRRDIAMTGEISLRGRVMAIGGLKEKTMAALRTGIHTVIIPADNEKDLEEIDQSVRSALNFISTDHVDKILDTALIRSEIIPASHEDGESHAMPIPDSGESQRRSIRQ
ncbi:MAG: endopeptidase La [Oscillospiraceae bacterium]|nr:endopeptidase La [Oscillospiraceae bacterium]